MLSWEPLAFDPCVTYEIWTAERLPGLTRAVRGLVEPVHVDAAPLGPEGIRFLVVAADSAVAGPGPTGH